MNDVFDEDLMKELGLDPDEVAATPKPGNASARKPVPSPAAGTAAQPPQTAPPRAPAPQRTAPAPRPPATVPVQRVTQPQAEVDAREISTEAHALRMTENLPVQLAAVLAKKTIVLKDIVDLRVGEIVDFKKAPQEPLDLVANGKLIAKAEMVLVDGRLGAKIVKLVK